MWPFKKLTVEVKSELTDPSSEAWQALLAGVTPSASGIHISADTAMRVPAVNAAVTLISGAIRTLPCKLYKASDDGKESARDHDAYALVHDDSNAWQSAGKVRELVTIDALLHGDGYALVTKSGAKPLEIIHLPRSAVTLEHLDTGEPRYKVNERLYGPSDIIHLQAPSLDGKRGLGLLAAGADAIALAILLERTAARLFRNNQRPGSVLSFKSNLTPVAATRIGQAWKAAHGGDASGGVAVIDGDATYTPIAFTSVESQHQEQRNFAIGEVSRLTRVPVTMLGDLSHGSFANTEQQALQFLQLCLLPWLAAWTDAYRRTLLNADERGSYSFEFIVDDLLRADTATRAESYAKFRAAGVMTGNDVRRKESMSPHPDGDVLASPYTTPGKPANDNPSEKESVA